MKIHIKEQPGTFGRFDVLWTPTLLLLEPEGKECYRFEGFLPVDDFLSQLELGLAHTAFKQKKWQDAEQRYRRVVDRFPQSAAAPEAVYWQGVSRYKAAKDAGALADTARRLNEKFPESEWSKKASVWAKEKAEAGRS